MHGEKYTGELRMHATCSLIVHRFQGREGKIQRGLKKQIDRTELFRVSWAMYPQKMAHPCITIDLKKKRKEKRALDSLQRIPLPFHVFKKSFSPAHSVCAHCVVVVEISSRSATYFPLRSQSRITFYFSSTCATIVFSFFFFLTSFWTLNVVSTLWG